MSDLILNRYKAIKQVGKGGFGTVIVAWDTRMRRKVAIKVIELGENIKDAQASKSTRIISDENAETQVINMNKKKQKGKSVDDAGEHWEDVPGLTEARTAAMIQDPNIVTVHDFELENNNAYIIMEYVEGLTLSQFLDEYGDKMTLDMLTCIFSGIAHALEVAHSENVLHLDIKPDNVLIDSKGKVKVTDFGLATLADEFGYGTANAGTIGYMPPEQMRRGVLDIRSDEWALASITYEMLCGNNPFDAKDIAESLRKTDDAKLLLPSVCWEDLSEDVDNAIFRALSPNAEDRFINIESFDKAIMNGLSNPRAGQRQLAALFRDNEEEDAQEPQTNKLKLFEKLSNKKGLSILGRVFAVLASFPLAFVSVLNIPFFVSGLGSGSSSLNVWGIVTAIVIVAIAGIWPPLGVCLSAVALSLALIMSGNYIVGAVLALIAIVWCVYSFFKKVSNATSLASFSFFGSFGFSQIAPFLTGLFCDIKDCIINVSFGFVMCVILAGLGSMSLVGWEPATYISFANGASSYGVVQEHVFQLLTQISTWIWFASWLLCAVFVALSFKTKSRLLHVGGCIIAIAIMIIGICVANYFASNMLSWQPQGWELLPTLSAGIISSIIAFFLPNKD